MRFSVASTTMFERQFKKIDPFAQRLIKKWIQDNLTGCENPRRYGKSLSGNRKEQWRYRIGNYRIIVHIEDSELVILALTVGHRKEVYKKV